jgi:3-isopropylmalate/(R)-2-methylmalate dehydratase small subunit
MVLYATAHRVGDDITTDLIIAPAQRTDDPASLAGFCLAAVDPGLAERLQEGDLLLAGRGFGAGDDTDSAVLALQAVGFTAVICTNAAPGFAAAARDFGLPVLECPEAVQALQPGRVVRVDLEHGRITDRTTGASYQAPPCPPEVVAAARRSQLLLRMRRVVEEEGFDG